MGHGEQNTGVPELVVLAEQLLAPVPGGTGRYTSELLRALAVTTPPGWTVRSVVARHGEVASARVDGVPGPRVLPLSPRALAAAWHLGVPYWPGGDAVHATTPLAPPRVPRGRTLSVAVHDVVPWTHPETLTAHGVAWHRAAISRAARRAHHLVLPTAAVAEELGRHVRGNAAVRVIGHGPTERLHPQQRPAHQVGMQLPERYVLAIGTLEPRKGIDQLVEAVAGLDGVPLVLVGRPGWGEADPHALARAHGLPSERVRVLGGLSDTELASVLGAASVLAAPSRAEGFGLPVLEAMAAGVPVVHSDAPALVEVAGGAGISVPRGDVPALVAALRAVLGSPDRAEDLRGAGLACATEFSWRRAAESVWGLHTRRPAS